MRSLVNRHMSAFFRSAFCKALCLPMVTTRKAHQKPSTAETNSMTGVELRNTTGKTVRAAKAMAATCTFVKWFCKDSVSSS